MCSCHKRIFSIFVFYLIILSCNAQNCILSHTIETAKTKIKYNDKIWNYFKANQSHVFVYYDEKNFDRREDIELSIDFLTFLDSIPMIQLDSVLIAHLTEEKKKQLENGVTADYRIIKRDVQIFGKRSWDVFIINATAEEKGRKKEAVRITFYYNIYKNEFNVITVMEKLPLMASINKEINCILKSLNFSD